MISISIFALVLTVWSGSVAVIAYNDIPARDKYPHIISHRGSAGYVPEHSLQAYQLAIDLKTDYIELDLCLSKDDVFVALHDILLDSTTNVADFPEYADRKKTQIINENVFTGFFVCDFTMDELLTLSLNQRVTTRTHLFDGYFKIPTLYQAMDLIATSYNTTEGTTIGLYVELKNPAYYASLGFHMEDQLLSTLSQGGYRVYTNESVPNDLSKVLPVVIECFDNSSLKYISTLTAIPLVQLINQDWYYYNRQYITEVSKYAQGIGPDKEFLVDMGYKAAQKLVQNIHDEGLFIHPYTFRADQNINPVFNNDFYLEEMYYFCCLGVDGLFSEFPDRTRETIDIISNFSVTKVILQHKFVSCTLIDCWDYSRLMQKKLAVKKAALIP